MDDGVIFVDAPDIIGDRDIGAALLNGVEVAMEPALRVAHIRVDENDVGMKPVGHMQDRPVRPRAPAESGPLGEAEGLEERHHLDASCGSRQRSLHQHGARLSFSDNHDCGVLRPRLQIALRCRDEGGNITAFFVERDADDDAGGADASHCRLHVRMDHAVEFIDLPGSVAYEQR